VTSTADVLDAHPEESHVCRAPLAQFGGHASFEGTIATIRCFEDNVLLNRQVDQAGNGRVLVVDGGGSTGVALLGDRIAGLAEANGWAGLVVNGAVRDVAALRTVAIGIRALGANPRPSRKVGDGAVDVEVEFGGVVFRPGAMLYSDDDGVVVLDPPR
jgi:regulator of ribonuclease activity A